MRRFGALFLPAVLILANAAGLLTQVLLPHLLAETEYARFSIQWAYGQFVALFAYEFLRQPVMRFALSSDAQLAAQRRTALMAGYVAISALLLTLCATTLALGRAWPIFLTASPVLLYGVLQGPFDGAQALARAESANLRFSLTWIARSLFSLAFVLAAAHLTGAGTVSVIALGASYPLSLLLWHRHRLRLPTRQMFRQSTNEDLRLLLGYGAFTATAASITTLIPALFRSIAASALGPDGSAGALLSFDLSLKVILLVGFAVNIVVAQKSFHTAEFGTDSERRAQNAKQIVIPAAMILPCAAGFLMVQPQLSPLIVPDTYMPTYTNAVGWSCLSAAALALRTFALDPVFASSKQYKSVLIGPTMTLVLSLALSLMPQHVLVETPHRVFALLSLPPIAGLLVSLLSMPRDVARNFPWKDVAKIGVSTVIMVTLGKVIKLSDPIPHLIGAMAVCSLLYAFMLWILNVGDIRSLTSKIWQHSREMA